MYTRAENFWFRVFVVVWVLWMGGLMAGIIFH